MTDQSPPLMTLRFDQLWNAAMRGGDAEVFAAPGTIFRPVDWLSDRAKSFQAGVAICGDHRGPILTLRRPDRPISRMRFA